MNRRRLKLEQTQLTSGTCEWLFRHEKYKAWETSSSSNSSTSVLLIEGKAGSGKSTLMHEAVARAEAIHRDSKSICLSYFFDAAKDEGLSTQISPQGLYRSMLSQLLKKAGRSPDVVAMIREWGPVKEASQKELEDVVILKAKISRLLATLRGKTLRIFIDAIDECGKGKDGGTTDTVDMLKYIQGLQGQETTVLVLLSIRDRAQFGSSLSVPTIEMSHHNQQDIFKYLNDTLKYSGNLDVREQLIRTLLHRSSNVFLWAELVVESINLKANSGLTDAELKQQIDQIPQELEGIYSKLLDDLESENRSEALILLQLVQVCMRPLDLLEIRSALEYARGTDNGPNKLVMSEEQFEARIRRICRGFIEIQVSEDPYRRFRPYGIKGLHTNQTPDDLCELPEPDAQPALEPKRLVKFTHESVRDFLDTYGWGKLDIEPSPHSTALRAHLEVTILCMRTVGHASGETPFLPYASQFWTVHGRNANEAIDDGFEPPKFVTNCSYKTKGIISRYKKHSNDPYSLNYLQIADITKTGWLADNATMLMLLAFEGCGNLLARHGDLCTRKDCRESSATVQDAFALALLRGWKAGVEAVRDVAQKRSIKLDPTITAHFTKGICPLQWICKRGQHEILKSIMNLGWDTSSTAARVSFLEGVNRGHVGIVELFLDDAGDDVLGLLSWQSSQGYTALHYAASAGRWRIFEMLLDRLGDIPPEILTIKEKKGETVLDVAKRGKERHGGRRNYDLIIPAIEEILMG